MSPERGIREPARKDDVEGMTDRELVEAMAAIIKAQRSNDPRTLTAVLAATQEK